MGLTAAWKWALALAEVATQPVAWLLPCLSKGTEELEPCLAAVKLQVMDPPLRERWAEQLVEQ